MRAQVIPLGGGTEYEQREGIDFIDLDLQDDATNDETKVKTHRLTEEEFGDIIDPPKVQIPSGGGSSEEYSMEEKVIGTWIDEKPIYQKTILYSTPVSVPGIGSAGATVATISNIKMLIEAVAISDGNCPINTTIFWLINGNEIRTSSSAGFNMKFITLRYTKTTD